MDQSIKMIVKRLSSDHTRQLIQKSAKLSLAEFIFRYEKIPQKDRQILADFFSAFKKSKEKLPTWYQNVWLITQKAVEQSTREAVASQKSSLFSGENLLDLTCGAGVDAWHFAAHFHSVVALEADPLLAEMTKQNFAGSGCKHITVLNQRAQEFLEASEDEFDLIYADPDRRPGAGRKFLPEDLLPNIPQLMPLIRRHTSRLLLKMSPMLDVSMADRIFPGIQRIFIFSYQNDCKEILLDISLDDGNDKVAGREVHYFRKGAWHVFQADGAVVAADIAFEDAEIQEGKYWHEGDAGIYKADLAPEYFSSLGRTGRMTSARGFWVHDEPLPDFPGNIFRVSELLPFQPKRLKKEIKKRETAPQLVLRNAGISAAAAAEKLGFTSGKDDYLIITMIGKQRFAAFAELLQ